VHLKVARNKKGSHAEELKQYVAWYLEQYHRENLFGARIVLIFDFTNAGITNVVNVFQLDNNAESLKYCLSAV
jgi:hypothetical protein